MKLMFDLNVLLDVFQNRVPHYQFSSLLVKEVLKHTVVGVLPAHGITTIHYILTKYADRSKADKEIDWLLSRFEVADCGKSTFIQARSLAMNDFEDAVVAALAQITDCDFIVTRNEDDFTASPVTAITPKDFVEKYLRIP